MKKIIIICLVTGFLLAVNVFSLQKINVIAEAETVSIVLDSDSQQSFDFIEQFNEHGLAMITKIIDGEYYVGLINNLGEIVIEPQFFSMFDYNQDMYVAFKHGPDFQGYPTYLMGLISKKDGSYILPVEYTGFDLIFGHDIFMISRAEITQVETPEEIYDDIKVFSRLVSLKDGIISDVPLPNGIIKENLRTIYSLNINQSQKMFTAEIYTEYDYSTFVSWFTDRTGQIINNTAYINISQQYIHDGTMYFSYDAKFSHFDNLEQGGIIKVNPQEPLSIEDVIDYSSEAFNDYYINKAWFFHGRNSIVVLNYPGTDTRYYDLRTNEFSLERPDYNPDGPFEVIVENYNYSLKVSDEEIYTDYDYIYYLEDLRMYVLEHHFFDTEEGLGWYTSKIYHVDSRELSIEYLYLPADQLLRLGYAKVMVGQDRQNFRYGIIDSQGKTVLDPIYFNISEFNIQGYASVCKDHLSQCGLVDLNYQFILEPEYELGQFEQESPFGNAFDAPLFDKNGHIKIMKLSEGNWGTAYSGIASREGIILEPIYYQAYFMNNLYYTQLHNVYTIFNEDKSIFHQIDPIASDFFYYNIEFLNNEYFIISGYDSEFAKGVMDIDKNLVIPFDYHDIKYDGEFFYLTKYDPNTGRYLNAVMNKSYEFVVNFDTGYDSVSEFVGDYAVATKTSEEGMITLSTTLMSYDTASNFYALEIINRSGVKVGDFTNQYESIQLLSEHEDYILVLVKKDGVYYKGKLVQVDGVEDPDDPLDVFKNMANMGDLLAYLKENNIPVTQEWIKAALMYFHNQEGKTIPKGFYVVKGLVYFDNEVVMTMKEYQFFLKDLKME